MKINKILAVLLALFLPYIILMAGVRLIMTPAFPAFEYNRANFPLDPYGFSLQERTKWSEYAVSYLTNDKEIDSWEICKTRLVKRCSTQTNSHTWKMSSRW